MTEPGRWLAARQGATTGCDDDGYRQAGSRMRDERSGSPQSEWTVRRRSHAAQLRRRRRVHWKIVAGAPIDPKEMPLALETAEELGSRLSRGLLMGAMFGAVVAIHLPEFLPPADAFSWGLVISASLAVVTYLFGLLVVFRARLLLRTQRASVSSS